MPFSRAYFIAMFINELGSFHLAEKFVGVAADVACGYFIEHHFALRVDNKGASFSDTVGFDVNVQILGQLSGGIADHGEFYLADTFGRFMPSFVNEMGIAGYGIDFASDFLEFIIFVLQIFQFCGAYKGEICGIEEENAPLANEVLIAYIDEITVLIRFDLEFADFLTV